MADPIIIAATILSKIAPLAQHHLTAIWGLNDELKKLQFLVSLIQATHQKAKDRNVDPVVKAWLDNLSDIMEEINGILDYFKSRTNRDSAKSLSSSSNNSKDKPGDDQKKPIKKEEDGCSSAISYLLSHPNPIFWVRDGVMALKIKSVRQRLTDNVSDMTLLKLHPSIENEHALSSSNNQSSIIPPSARTWSFSSNYFTTIRIDSFPDGETLPAFHILPHLEELRLNNLTLEYIFQDAEDSLPSGKLFPKLKELYILNCQNLKGWWKLPMPENNDQPNIPYHFPCIARLDIREFRDLIWFPLFHNVSRTLYMESGSICHWERTMKALPYSSHFNFKYLWFSKVRDLIYLDIELFPYLEELELYDCIGLRFWGKKGEEEKIATVPSKLKVFDLRNCPILTCLPQGMDLLESGTKVKITGCGKLKKKYASKSGPDWPFGVDKYTLDIDW